MDVNKVFFFGKSGKFFEWDGKEKHLKCKKNLVKLRTEVSKKNYIRIKLWMKVFSFVKKIPKKTN